MNFPRYQSHEIINHITLKFVYKFYYIMILFYVIWKVIYKFYSQIGWALFELNFVVVFDCVVFISGIITVYRSICLIAVDMLTSYF